MALEPFIEASHRLCRALHEDMVDPHDVEIVLPRDAWWRLWTRIEQHYRGFLIFDGRGSLPAEFRFMGIKYRWK